MAESFPASYASIQGASWSGSVPVLLSLAPTSLSSPAQPRPIHKMASRATYLHLALREETVRLSGYAPAAAAGLSQALSGITVEEPPDEDEMGRAVEGGDAETTEEKDDKTAEKEQTSETDSHPNESRKNKASYPECWFEDEESGVPLRWHLFVGVLYDLMKGKATINNPAQQNFLPWRIRVHFASYPSHLLPMDDGLGHSNNNDVEIGCRMNNLVKRIFRNSLKQALFMQYASSKVAMAITKSSHEKIWNAVMESNYESYHEENVELQSGITLAAMSTQSSTTLLSAEDEQNAGVPQLIPVRLMLNFMPAIQKPIKHRKDVEQKKPTELLTTLGTYQVSPYNTLGDILVRCLPNHFAVNRSTERVADIVSDRPTYYCIQGVRPSMKCAMLDLWRALSHPDHFLYIIVVTE